MIGIIGAMSIEVDAIKELMTDKTEQIFSGITYVCGKLSGKEIVVAKCGIGKVSAAVCTQTMILEYSPTLIVNTGVGGSLSTELAIGDIAVANAVVQHDMDTSALGDPVGYISGLNVVEIPCDTDTVNTALGCIESLGTVKGVAGTIASGDQFIADKAKKDAIVKNFGAIVCEMEGASIGHVCYMNGVKFAVVRAVSDCADGSSHMDYAKFLPVAAANATEIIRRMVEIA